MKVLIVEDDALVSAFIADALAEDGHDFDVARNGTWGLAAAEAGDHDVIVLDVNLPDITGFEVTERLRERGNQTPILMLTARIAEGDIIRGLNVGADDYLTKPCKPGELLARLRALARRRSLGSRAAAPGGPCRGHPTPGAGRETDRTRSGPRGAALQPP